MKILIYSDVHISQDSSIVRGLKGKFSTRLYYIIKSLNWAESLADKEGCNYIFNLGDTFDKPIINAMEATAVQDIKWSSLPHYVLVGNHDSNVSSLEYSSVSILKKLNFNIIDKPEFISTPDLKILLLPYITEYERKSLNDYWKDESLLSEHLNIINDKRKSIIFSHNDISGFNFGGFISKEGFSIDEINKECDLFLNGHLHNSSWLDKKILNVGNLCGQNFSENSFKYKHGAWILDTDTLEIKFYANPYSLNFYKVDVNKNKSLLDYSFDSNPVLMIKCERESKDNLYNDLNKINSVANRILLYDDDKKLDIETEKIELKNSIDYIKEFSDFILKELGRSDVVEKELAEICK